MSAKKIPRISETEWEVMRAVWAKHPATASEIIERLRATDPSWHPKTAKTLLARLVQKQALDYDAHGRLYVYEPLISEHDGVTAASDSFLDRVFDGSLKPLLAHFVTSRRLTRKDLDELKELLENETRKGKKS